MKFRICKLELKLYESYKYRKSNDLEYNSWLIGTSDFESSQKLHEPFGECNLRIVHELYEKVVWFFIYSTFNKITSFPWKLNRYSYGVQFGINCIALHQSKLSNFVGCTIRIRYRRENCLQVYNYKIKYHGWQINLKDDFQSILHSLRTQMFFNINGSLDRMRIDVIR